MKIKLISIVGNRPQFIKLKPLEEILKKYKNNIIHKIVHTGQHYDKSMSHIFFDELKLSKPNNFLNIGGLSHARFTSKVIEKLEILLKKENPDGIIVYGDTNTTLAASICCSKLDIDIFHIEAGLRSYDKKMPEEINRVLTDHLSHLHFVPNKLAKLNLLKENISSKKIKLVGDLMYELLYISKKLKNYKTSLLKFKKKEKYILLTIHRAENTENKNKTYSLIKSISKVKFKVIWPCHPRTKKFLKENKIIVPKNISIIDPLGYYDMLACINNSILVLTDSGGVQKEAFFLGKQSIILRDKTEWKEILKHENSVLLKNKNLNNLVKKMINKKFVPVNYYGFQNVSKKIVNHIIKFYEKK